MNNSINEKELVEFFEKHNVLVTGHFQNRSGRHSDKSINKDVMTVNPELLLRIFSELHNSVVNENFPKFDIIMSFSLLGVSLASTVALQLHKPFIYAEKGTDKFSCPSTFVDLIKGNKVLIIEGVINTGNDVEKLVRLVNKSGGEVVATQCVWNTTRIEEISKIPLFNLVQIEINSWRQQDCQLCMDKIPNKMIRR